MLKQLILVRGLPGSGKSTITHFCKNKHKDSCHICNTDQYWERPDGEYDFNWELLGQSHAWNQHRVEEILMDEMDNPQWDTIIIVDNTNITFNEMKPYIKLALEYDYEVVFLEPDTSWKYDVEKCFELNIHGVPYATILKMSQRWESNEVVIQKLEEFNG